MARSIRAINETDIEQLLVLARAMHDESPRYRVMEFLEDKALGAITLLLAKGGGFVAEEDGAIVGMVGGIICEHFFSSAQFVSDLVLYVKPKHRGSFAGVRLIKALEEWAQGQGIKEILLGVSTEVDADATVCVYQRLGYRMTGYNLIKTRE